MGGHGHGRPWLVMWVRPFGGQRWVMVPLPLLAKTKLKGRKTKRVPRIEDVLKEHPPQLPLGATYRLLPVDVDPNDTVIEQFLAERSKWNGEGI